MSKLIILRGNSGSGKSTVARHIAQSGNHKIAIVDADAYRVDMLFPKPIHKEDLAALMQHNVLYCLDNGYDVIWDSIFHANERNKQYLGNFVENLHPHENFIFNFKISFEETARRHNTRHKRNDFKVSEMKEWYLQNEDLGYDFEYTVPESSSLDMTVSLIKNTVWPASSEAISTD